MDEDYRKMAARKHLEYHRKRAQSCPSLPTLQGTNRPSFAAEGLAKKMRRTSTAVSSSLSNGQSPLLLGPVAELICSFSSAPELCSLASVSKKYRDAAYRVQANPPSPVTRFVLGCRRRAAKDDRVAFARQFLLSPEALKLLATRFEAKTAAGEFRGLRARFLYDLLQDLVDVLWGMVENSEVDWEHQKTAFAIHQLDVAASAALDPPQQGDRKGCRERLMDSFDEFPHPRRFPHPHLRGLRSKLNGAFLHAPDGRVRRLPIRRVRRLRPEKRGALRLVALAFPEVCKCTTLGISGLVLDSIKDCVRSTETQGFHDLVGYLCVNVAKPSDWVDRILGAFRASSANHAEWIAFLQTSLCTMAPRLAAGCYQLHLEDLVVKYIRACNDTIGDKISAKAMWWRRIHIPS